ncbi:nuclear factor of activated T-cells, cytoplasmic 2 isoform X2 [Denticeps clupeoides]|uniref:RHD domain-containing protein n=1 Tax=Denticeps clupeoides TaxID=299321 RepID=A0AAY4EH57_9TELE|nr:nuclear factor of activated T-cells, cytoplasmic 2-like isoform X2 [Denticeps clupeoides]
MSSIYTEGDSQSSTQANSQEEMDLTLLFLYNQPCHDEDEPENPALARHEDALAAASVLHHDQAPYSLPAFPHAAYHLSSDRLPVPEAPDLAELLEHSGSFRPGGPRIEITYSELHPRDHAHTEPLDISPRPTLTVPGLEGPAYRGETQCLSPASSNSSTSWSEVCSPWTSPCVSPSGGGALAERLQDMHAIGSPRASPTTSPRASITEEAFLACRSPSPRPGSRSASPSFKRTYDMYKNPALVAPRSRSPSPHRGHEEGPEPHGPPANLDGRVRSSLPRPVPTKLVRPGYCEDQPDAAVFQLGHEVKAEPLIRCLDPVYVVPAHWPGQPRHAVCSAPVSSLPSPEWPLPSRTDHYELAIEVQPKPHHRAHYETEGSRGAVKASAGGHPVVQLRGYRGPSPLALQVFIGTADERVLKPHSFYQVHRITGKTVTTSSQERILCGTKVLEIPLDPKDNMRAIVDCAGILKLKNADIELRKGETDIGRKNTRVRLVFRVHVPQPGGQWASLQVASQPIECSQRSAHELPAVERQDVDRCSVLGGLQMVLTGQNFTSDSKVVFTEKTPDGFQIWEAEATVDRDKSQASMLFVEVPPYRDQNIVRPAKVNFYVLNGRRKRSQPQHFTYTALTVPYIKAEPVDDFQFGQLGCAVSQILGVSPLSRHHAHPVPPMGCGAPGVPPHPQGSPGPYGRDPEYLQCPPVFYQGQAENLSCGPPLFPEHGAPGGHGGYPARQLGMAAPLGTAGYGVRPGSVVAEQQRVVMGDCFQAEASRFPDSDLGVAVPRHGRHPAYPLQERGGAGALGRVTVKQENLDHLDDVNDIIRKDLMVLGIDQP